MDIAMYSIRPNRVEVVTSVQRRRRGTPKQKLEIVKKQSTRKHCSLAGVGANETVLPASEPHKAMRSIK